MIKQLQTRILKLEEIMLKKQNDFQQQKQKYEKCIQKLQAENQNLKNTISQLNTNQQEKGSLSRFSRYSNIKQQDDKLSDFELKQGQNNSFQNQMQDLVKQNNYLKDQIANISITYQRQIDQLTHYFEKIKSSSRLQQSHLKQSSSASRTPGKVSLLMNAYENVLKNFDSERMKYTQKIEELTKYIIWSEQKNKQLNRQKSQFQLKSRLCEQQLRIFKENVRV